MPANDGMQLGIAALVKSAKQAGLTVFESKRPWNNRRATYFLIGKPDRRTDIVLSDEFISDLPNTREYREALDSYASAVAGRASCNTPEIFYCLSGMAIRVEIDWPIQSGIVGSNYVVVLLVGVTDLSNGSVAKCSVRVDGLRFNTTEADRPRSAINRVRTAVDRNAITFHPPNVQQERFQKIEAGETRSMPPQPAIERFLVGKVYSLGFRIIDAPGQVWIADPWDSEYLGVSPRDLSQAAHVMQARGLIDLDESGKFARPNSKLLTSGLSVLNEVAPSEQTPKLSLSNLPNKETLIRDLNNGLKRKAGLAVLVIDLDHFKAVNDTKGHQEGDACLERVVKTIADVVGQKGSLYRWGGDEFAVMLPDFSIEEAYASADRIRRAVEQARPGGDDIGVTTSIGVIATDVVENPSAEKLLELADQAMYESKRQGKNRVTSGPLG